MEFVKYLKEQRPGKRLAIFWDGASYHDSQELIKKNPKKNGV